MDIALIKSNILNPPILFFFLGMLTIVFKSDLKIPDPIPKMLSLYLLLCIGFKGGVEISKSGISQEVATTLLVSIALSALVPIYTFFILKKRMGPSNAGAIAATYGSVSAVTFITATDFLKNNGVEFGGHMVASLALMESPAIVMGILLAKYFSLDKSNHTVSLKTILHEAFFSGPVFLIFGSLIIGMLCGEQGATALKPFTHDIFKGALVIFLLDMGIVAAQRLNDFKQSGLWLMTFAIIVPLVNAALGLVIAHAFGFTKGNAFLFTVLCASASYIAVPAAMRISLKESNPSIYLPMSLGVTFPLNIAIGLPLYYALILKFF